MNLIEQLGGYEKAKIIKGCREVGGLSVDENLEYELLEYRRQHNIYEAGDLIVMVDADDYDTIFKVIGKPQRLYHLQGDDDLFYGRLDFQIRHATDEEIKSGDRIKQGKSHD